MNALHPSNAIHGILNSLDLRFCNMGIRGLEFFTGIIRKHQKRQDAVSAETIREVREAQERFLEIIADGEITKEEREGYLSFLREIEIEQVEGRVIEGSNGV